MILHVSFYYTLQLIKVEFWALFIENITRRITTTVNQMASSKRGVYIFRKNKIFA